WFEFYSIFSLRSTKTVKKKHFFSFFILVGKNISSEEKPLRINFTTIIFCSLHSPSSVIQYWRGFQKI
ncbi:MAG: hypothetical protein CVU51_05780, partial [Deltaproteobacteria bacterium HGW-Deltaproteobacteria-1]